MADLGNGLRAIQDLLLVLYTEGLLDEEEFLLLYDANYSREIYPYWNFPSFDLMIGMTLDVELNLDFQKMTCKNCCLFLESQRK